MGFHAFSRSSPEVVALGVAGALACQQLETRPQIDAGDRPADAPVDPPAEGPRAPPPPPSPADRPLLYTAPACPLRYAFDATLVVDGGADDRAPSPPAQGLRVRGELEATASEGAGIDLALRAFLVGHRRGDLDLPALVEPPERLPVVHLRRVDDGRALAPVGDPPPVWRRFATGLGLLLFWPPLPGDDAIAWDFEVLGEDGAPVPVHATVARAGSGEHAGAPLVRLEARWSAGDGAPQTIDLGGEARSLEVRTSGGYQATYSILTSGRLLEAAIVGAVDVEMRPADAPTLRIQNRVRAGVHLIGACDGPVLDLPAAAPTADEAAIAAVAALRDALAARDADAILRHLDPALAERHGRDRLVATLLAHFDRYSLRALGYPEIAIDARADGDALRVHLIGGAADYAPDTPSMTVHTVLRVLRHGDAHVITSIGTDTYERDEGWELLEVTPSRLASAAVAPLAPPDPSPILPPEGPRPDDPLFAIPAPEGPGRPLVDAPDPEPPLGRPRPR